MKLTVYQLNPADVTAGAPLLVARTGGAPWVIEHARWIPASYVEAHHEPVTAQLLVVDEHGATEPLSEPLEMPGRGSYVLPLLAGVAVAPAGSAIALQFTASADARLPVGTIELGRRG